MRFTLAGCVLVVAVLVAACGSASTPGGGDGGDDVIDAPPGDGPGGATIDAPPGSADASPGASDGGPGGDGVACGFSAMCTPDQVCCLRMPPACQSPAQLCNMGVIGCDGPEDCPGQVCCGTPGGSSCMAACDATAPEMCHDVSTCTTGDSCCSYGGGPAMDPYQHL